MRIVLDSISFVPGPGIVRALRRLLRYLIAEARRRGSPCIYVHHRRTT